MPSNNLLNRYQSIRQYYFNPSNLGPLASVNAEALNNYLNPGTVITSLLQDQKNILRYQGMKPIKITSSYMASKSGTKLQMLISKILSTEDANYAINGPKANAAIIAITNFDSAVNISDYEILVFDEDGYRISDFENCTWFVINNTLYIVHLNCTKYLSDLNNNLSPAESVDVVLMRKSDNSSKIRAGKLAFLAVPNIEGATDSESFISITNDLQPMTDLPEDLYLKYDRNFDLKKDSFLKYNTSFYGLAIYLSEYEIEAERDGLTDFTELELKEIQEDINFNFKSWIFVNPDLYTVENDSESLIVHFKEDVDTVEDLGLKIQARNPRYNPAYINDVSKIISISVKQLATYSAFYLYNKATFMGTEFSYTAVKTTGANEPWDGSVEVRVSPKSTVPANFIIDSFRDAQGNINYGPKYIPLAWEKPSVINDTEMYQEPNDTDAHLYSRWLAPEDVFVFVDGVKLTPYVDYVVANEAIEGEDFPAGSLVFVSINEDNESVYSPFPMVDLDTDIVTHYIQVFTIPPSICYNKYKGPHYDNLTDRNVIRDDTVIHDGEKDGLVDMNVDEINLPISMLGQNNYITFKGGRYIPIAIDEGRVSSPRVILDNELSYNNLSGYRDVEVHTYFEESKSTVMNNLVGTIATYNSYIESLLFILSTSKYDYEKKASEGIVLNVPGSTAKNGIAGVTANNFELWLRHNTLLRTTTDIHSETKRRVPDRQTYFSAGEDLTAQGYVENIRVTGAANSPENYGMPLDTASADVHNEDTEENNEG